MRSRYGLWGDRIGVWRRWRSLRQLVAPLPPVTKMRPLVQVSRLIQAFGGAEHAGMEGKAFCGYRLTRENAIRNERLRSGPWFSRLEMSV